MPRAGKGDALVRAAANPDRTASGRHVDDCTALSDIHHSGCDQSTRCCPRIVHKLPPLLATDGARGVRRTDRGRRGAFGRQLQHRFFKTHVCGGTLATTVAAHISTMHPGDPMGAGARIAGGLRLSSTDIDDRRIKRDRRVRADRSPTSMLQVSHGVLGRDRAGTVRGVKVVSR